jgi:hypothetical protein
MFRFSTPAEVVRAFEMINSDYARHSRAARQLAETYFDGKKVLKNILEQALA